MNSTTLLAAAADEPNPGWGKLLGLVGAGLLFWILATVHKRVRAAKDLPDTFSSSEDQQTPEGVNDQVGAPSDPSTPPQSEGQKRQTEQARQLAEFMDANLDGPTNAVLTRAMATFRISLSTAKRARAAARERADAALLVAAPVPAEPAPAPDPAAVPAPAPAPAAWPAPTVWPAPPPAAPVQRSVPTPDPFAVPDTPREAGP